MIYKVLLTPDFQKYESVSNAKLEQILEELQNEMGTEEE